MTSEATKPRRAGLKTHSSRPHDRKVVRQEQRAAINAVRTLGEKAVSVIVSWEEGELAERHVTFKLSGHEAATLMAGVVRTQTSKQSAKASPSLIPSPALVDAIEEARALKGRFASADELFDTLEAEGQS